MLSLAGPCFLNSSQFLLSLPEQTVPVLHPRQCLQLPGKLVVQTYPTAGEPVPGYTNRTASLQPPSKCGTSGSERERLCEQVVAHCHFPVHQGHQLECACLKFALGETACNWPSEPLHFTDAAWQSNSTSICETRKEGLKSKQSKEQFYSVPGTVSYLHTRRSPITGRILFGTLDTHLGEFDHQRDSLEQKVIFCSACIYTQLSFTYAQSQRLSVH